MIGRFRATLSAGAGYTWSAVTQIISYPIFESDWLSWTPTYAAGGSMTFTTITTDCAQYRVCGRACEFEFKAHGTTGGSAANSITATHPFTATNGGQNNACPCYVADTAVTWWNMWNGKHIVQFQ